MREHEIELVNIGHVVKCQNNLFGLIIWLVLIGVVYACRIIHN